MTASSSSPSPTPPPLNNHHPDFAPGSSLMPSSEVILTSADGTAFYVPTYPLLSSGFFRTMLSLPQAGQSPSPSSSWTLTASNYDNATSNTNSSSSKDSEVIHTSEPTSTLHTLLLMLCSRAFPPWSTHPSADALTHLESVLFLADKWDIPSVISIIRLSITSLPLLTQTPSSPLLIYVLCTRFGWTEEARIASGKTLGMCLFDAVYHPVLSRLEGKDLLALFDLHRSRRITFKKLLDSQEAFNVGNNASGACLGCGKMLDNHTWRDLKTAMVAEMDPDPSGESLFGSMDKVGMLEESTVAWACWKATCGYCRRENYDKKATIESIRACVKGLKSTV